MNNSENITGPIQGHQVCRLKPLLADILLDLVLLHLHEPARRQTLAALVASGVLNRLLSRNARPMSWAENVDRYRQEAARAPT